MRSQRTHSQERISALKRRVWPRTSLTWKGILLPFCVVFALRLLPAFMRLMSGFPESSAGGSRNLACFLRYGMRGLSDFPRGGVSIFFTLAGRFT